jgi:hypothetical protein
MKKNNHAPTKPSVRRYNEWITHQLKRENNQFSIQHDHYLQCPCVNMDNKQLCHKSYKYNTIFCYDSLLRVNDTNR